MEGSRLVLLEDLFGEYDGGTAFKLDNYLFNCFEEVKIMRDIKRSSEGRIDQRTFSVHSRNEDYDPSTPIPELVWYRHIQYEPSDPANTTKEMDSYLVVTTYTDEIVDRFLAELKREVLE